MDPYDPRMPDTDPTAADAEWKRIQQNTFTRWCNEHLKCVNQYIYNLETDLCDGLKLIALLQVLSHKKLPRHTKKPVFKSQKIENVSIALKFIEDENIRLVNIDASDIVKGNLKLILGLVWTLILKYQISMPYMEEEEEGAPKMTPKQALLAWVKSKMPESVPMDNFTNHWNDGRAIACLVDAVAPGLLPECEDLDPKDKLENAKNAMKLAEDWLGVPQVLTPEDMTNPKVDELSIMTYVSYFPEAKLKPGAPLKPRVHPSTKVSAKGPGVEPKGLVVNQPANFTVFSQGAGLGKLGVKVFGPSKEELEVFVTDNGDHTYSCQYYPTVIGKYDVHIKWNGRHIPKSPFRVQVESDLDAKKAYASGPGLEPSGVVAGKYTDFRVFTKGAGEGKVTVKVIDPRGGEDVDVIVEEQENSEYFVEYQPVNAGKHTIKVMFGGQPIKGSPFHVNVAPPRVEPVPGKVRVYGAGVEPTGLKAGYRAPFTVDAKGAGDGELDVFVEGPNGEEKVDIKSHADGTFACVYFPQKFGKYVVNVTWSGVQVPNSPFNVKVGPSVDPRKIRAYGPGLESGVAGKPAHFTVETKGAGVDSLGFAIEGPSQAEIKCVDKGDGICEVTYFPNQPGKYAVHVTCGDEDIQNSPFMVPISPPGDASLCYAEGPGLEPEGVVSGAPAEFKVFTQQEPDQGEVEVKVIDGQGKKAHCQVTNNKDGTYSVVYYPTATGKYTVTITFNGTQIPKSPFKINVCQTNSTKCKAYGPGLEKGFVGLSNDFKIETKGAGEGGLGLTIEGPSEAKIECKDNGDGSCDVHYWPTDPGDYTINILYADQHIPGSPFKAKIKYPFDASKVKVEGPGIEPGIRADEPADIDVDTRLAGEAELTVEVLDDLNKPVKVDIDEEEEEGVSAVAYYPKKQGPHKVNIKYGGVHVPGSPFKVKISPRSEPGKVKVSGPGVEPTGVKAGQPTWFTIDTDKAGKGDIHVGVEPDGRGAKPVEKITVTEESKDRYKCEYVAPVDGPYKVDVKFDGKPVQGSPYRIRVAKGHDASKCKAQGDGLETAVIDQLAEFDVDCSKAGDAPLTASVKNPSGGQTDTLVTDNEDGTYAVSYTPVEEGPHTLDVKYGGDHIPGSPFKVNVQPPTDSTKCKAYGPGLERAYVGKPADFTVETRGAGAGGLSLAVEGPSEAKLTCTDNGDGTCSVRYVPEAEGDYDIHIKFADEHIPGSPFTAKVTRPVDASKVKCYGPGIDKAAPLYSKAPQEFTVDTSEAGDAPLDVMVTPPTGPAQTPDEIKEVGDGVYTVKYTPENEGRYQVGVKYGGKDVPNSPFRVRAGPPYDASKVKVSGPGIEEAVVDEPAEFVCDCTEAGTAPLSATVTPPGGGSPVPCVVKDNGDGTYTCGWNPDVPGRHNVDVKYGDRRVPKSPFRVNVKPSGDASKVKVKGLGPDDRPIIGKENEFLVDARDAGKGKPTCTMKTPNRKEVPVEVIDNGDQTFACKYVPTEEGRHPVDVKFGGETVPGSPFYVRPKHGKDVSKIKCAPKDDQKPVVEEEVCYEVDASPIESMPGEGIVTGSLTTPEGDRVPVKVNNNKDGTYDVLSTPKQPGPHKLDVKYDDIPIPGSPFKYDAVEGGPDRVKCFGPGLERGLVREPCEFTVVTKSAGPGGLSLAIEGPSKAEITCTDNGDGSCNVKYVPEEPGDYHIIIKYADQHVPGSPFIAKIYSSPDELDSAKPRPKVGKLCDVGLDIPDVKSPKDLEKLKASLIRPNRKEEEPIPLRLSNDGSPIVSFTPYEPGEHLIHVRKYGRDVENSPFSVLVGDEEEMISPVVEEGVQSMPDFPEDDAGPKVGNPCDVALDIPEIVTPQDLKKYKATLKRPSSDKEEPVHLDMNDDGSPVVTFTPREPGKHLLHIRKGGRDIPGSPFPIMVGDEDVKSKPKVGQPCDVALPAVIAPKDLKNLKATLKRPSSDREEPIDLRLADDGTPIVTFTPRENGKHLIHVRKFGRDIENSPFTVMVGDEEDKILPTVNQPCDTALDLPDVKTPEDLKNLKATIKRPSSDKEEQVHLEMNDSGSPVVTFTPHEPGKHLLHIRKGGRDIPGSPFPIMVGDEDVKSKPKVGQPCDVELDLPDVISPKDLKNLEATLKRPSSDREEPIVLRLADDGTPIVTFTPRETGKHLIHVRKFGRDIKNSPFTVMVGDEEDKILPTVNQPCDTALDLPDVKTPEDLESLKATIKRPRSDREEPVHLHMGDDGSPVVTFTPREPGKHLLYVKKYGRDIPGSPFPIMVGDEDVKSKPKVGQPCDVALPAVVSPKDLNNVKATLKRPSSDREEPIDLRLADDGTPIVTFTPRETGKHLIHVRKFGRDIKNSPFTVMVGDEEDKILPTVNQPCDTALDLPDVKTPKDLESLKATIKRPSSDKEEPVHLHMGDDGSPVVTFTPREPGKHLLHVKKYGRDIPGSPFPIMVGDEDVKSKPKVGQPCDAALPAVVSPKDLNNVKATLKRPSSDREEPIDLRLADDGTPIVTFTPRENGKHLIHLRKFGRDIENSPFAVMVGDEEDKILPTVNQPCDTALDLPDVKTPKDLESLKATIKRPSSDKEEPVHLHMGDDGSPVVTFTPREPGKHLLHVKKYGRDIPGSPFPIMVGDEDVKSKPKVGQPCDVELDLPDVISPKDLKNLKATLKRPSSDREEPIDLRLADDGTPIVTFTPRENGKHLIHLRKFGRDIENSPFAVMVGDEEDKILPTVNQPCDTALDLPDVKTPEDLKNLKATIKRPSSDREEPVHLHMGDDGSPVVTFTPREPGKHLLYVKKYGRDIPGSPFPIMVGDEDVKAKPTSNQPCDVALDLPYVKSPEDLQDLKATLKRPNSNREEPVDLRLSDDGSPIVTFIPEEPGEHLIHIRKHGRDVKNSPFTVMVQAPRLGDVYSVGHTCDVAIDAPGVNLPEDFDRLSATLRRPGSKTEEPVKLKINPDNTLGVSFVPRQPGEYFLTVKKSNKHIPGSPFSILVEAEEPVEAVGCPVDYCFDIPEISLPDDFDNLEATIKRPSSDKEEPISLKLNSDDTLSCSFVPKEVGIHHINIRKFGRHVTGSPFAVKVTTPEAVSQVDRPYGMGLDIPGINPAEDYPLLSATLKRPSSPKEEELRLLLNGDNTLGVAFTPREVGEHLIHVRKRGRDVEGSPFSVMVVGKEKVEEVHPVGRTCDVGLDIPGVNLPQDFKKLTASLLRPSGKKEESLKLELNPDDTLGVSFIPREPGEHKISVKKDKKDVPGSPFSIMVEAAEAVNAVGKPCECTLDIPGLRLPEDVKIVKATLKRPSSDKEEPVKLRVNSDNSLSVSFVPREPGEHLISVKRYGKHVSGSPFSVMVTAPEAGNAIGRPCGVGLEIPGLRLPEDFDRLTGTLKRPNSAQEEPLKLVLNSDNTLSVSFVPQETGEHLVSVMKDGKHVTGSPFSVMVSGPGPANPKKVKCYGPGLRTGVADKPAKFTVNTRDAGYGGLGLSIEGPSKAEINCVDNEDGTCDVDYLPTEPGKYTINVKFADEHVPGSPFTAMVKPRGSVVEEDILPERTSEVFEDLVSFGSPEAQPHDFVFDLKGYKVKDLKVTVISPKGETLDSEILETGENTYTIRFIPKESGEYTVNVKHRGVHIPGSPFKVYVEAPVWGGASKCFAAGPGLERGVVGHPGQFTVWTRDAGPGGLAVAVEGPAKAEIQCKDNGDGSCDITYLPTAPGEYTIHIRFADENIPDSPYKVYVYPEIEDRFRDLNVSDLSETGLKVGQPASFSVQTNAPVGKVSASVIAPSGSETPATVADLGSGNFAIRFVPREFGDHLVNVRFDGAHIPGSPFKIRVGGAEGHPEKVKAYGPGLSSGTAGQPAEFTVNALEAGSGALALSVDGPAKVKMNCTENPDGTYQVTYHPVIAGDYTISIKFAGQHIPGSAYNVKVYPSSGRGPYSDGDASKCTSRGAGLHRAVIGQPNTFTVNASNAGRGSLMVGVEGPAIPAKEITVKHTGGNVYAVNYALEESGAYILKVLWADKHIPGSPFHVTV